MREARLHKTGPGLHAATSGGMKGGYLGVVQVGRKPSEQLQLHPIFRRVHELLHALRKKTKTNRQKARSKVFLGRLPPRPFLPHVTSTDAAAAVQCK